jgi:ribosomal protein S18 acetylase RimI-like enzyme
MQFRHSGLDHGKAADRLMNQPGAGMFYIRSANEADLEAIRVLLVETWRETYTPFHGPQKIEAMIETWLSPQALEQRLRRPKSEFLVADDGRQIAGMAFAAMAKNTPNVANLHQLYVHPLWQRQGIGTDLFAEIETCFPDASTMHLEVTAENDRAIAFYETLGFQPIGRIDNVGPPGAAIPAILMEKQLDF